MAPAAGHDESRLDPTRGWRGLACLVAALAACSRPAATVEPEAGPGDAGPPPPSAVAAPAASPGGTDGGPATPAPAPVTAALATTSGQDQPLALDGVTLVDPGSSFRVEVGAQLTDGRLALHDEQDAMVPSTGTAEIGTSWTRYRLVPDGPLRAGSSYTLRVDGASSREAHDPAGRPYAPVIIELKTTGDRPAAPPPRKRARRR